MIVPNYQIPRPVLRPSPLDYTRDTFKQPPSTAVLLRFGTAAVQLYKLVNCTHLYTRVYITTVVFQTFESLRAPRQETLLCFAVSRDCSYLSSQISSAHVINKSKKTNT